MFNIVKLSAALEDPIPKRKPKPPLLSVVINKEEKQEVKEILDNCWYKKRFQFLIKQIEFKREHNFWKVASNVLAPDLIAEYLSQTPYSL